MANKKGMATGVEVARISVKVSPDTKKFRSELKSDLEAIERTMKGELGVSARLDTGQALADFRRLMSQMRAEAAKGVVIKVKTSVDDGGDSGKSDQKKALAAVSKSRSKLLEAPSFGTGINPAGYAVILAGVVALAGPLLGLITTALLSLPGLIALVATPIAALTLGIEGFKKAAETLKEPFENLKNLMSTKVQEQFTPVFESLRAIFPRLEASLPAVTKGLADMAQGVANAITRPENMNKIEETIRNIGTALTNAKPGVDDFVSGFIELARGLSETFPGLTDWFNGAGADFKEWVNGLDLKTAFEGLGSTIKVVLDLLGDLGKAGMEWIQDPSKVNDFKEGLKGIADILRDIAGLSSTLTNVFKNMLPSFNWDGIKEDLLKPFTSENAPWRKIVENNGNIFPNSITGEGAKQQVDGLKSSINETGAAAEANKAKVDALLSGAATSAPASGGGVTEQLLTGLAAPGAPVPPPNLEPAKTEITEYQSFVDDVSQQVRGALSQATSGETLPAPNFDAFKAAWNELPGIVQRGAQGAVDAAVGLISGVNAALQGGTQAILTTVTAWPQIIISALSGLYEVGLSAGTQLANGMVAGINSGIGWVTAAAANMAAAAKTAAESALGIKSPSKVFMNIGNQTAQGMGIGLEKGFGPVLAQAKDIAWKISEAFANGGDPTAALGGFQNNEVSRLEKVLSFEAKRLELQAKALTYQSKITGNEALKAKAEELRMQKDQITLQKEMLDLTQDYAELNGTGATKLADSPFASTIEDAMKMPFDFAQATGKQFLSDLGIGGNGALSAIADYGTGLASNFIFNVSNIDEAMAVRQNQVNKQGLGINGR